MFGNLLGVPALIIVFLATHHYLVQWDWIGDKAAIDALGVCLGLCAYYLIRGVDIFLEQKKDNPAPFVVPKAVPDAFGSIKELFSESSYGPFFWGIKTVDPETSRIVAILQFTELMGSGFMIPPIQAQRLMMVEVLVDAVPDSDQKPLYPNIPGNEEKALATIKMTWRIDSPLNRHTVNRIMDETTAAIRETLGLPAATNKPQPKSPFEPPGWLIALTVMAVLFCNQRAEEYTAFKEKREAEVKERQEQSQREQANREEANRKYREYQEEQRRKADELWRQQQQGTTGGTPIPYTPGANPVEPYKPFVNPFTPQLTPN